VLNTPTPDPVWIGDADEGGPDMPNGEGNGESWTPVTPTTNWVDCDSEDGCEDSETTETNPPDNQGGNTNTQPDTIDEDEDEDDQEGSGTIIIRNGNDCDENDPNCSNVYVAPVIVENTITNPECPDPRKDCILNTENGGIN